MLFYAKTASSSPSVGIATKFGQNSLKSITKNKKKKLDWTTDGRFLRHSFQRACVYVVLTRDKSLFLHVTSGMFVLRGRGEKK